MFTQPLFIVPTIIVGVLMVGSAVLLFTGVFEQLLQERKVRREEKRVQRDRDAFDAIVGQDPEPDENGTDPADGPRE